MIYEMRINSIGELQTLQRLACKVDEDVFIHSKDDNTRVDAKSFIGLFTLDFTQPVIIVTESAYLIGRLKKM